MDIEHEISLCYCEKCDGLVAMIIDDVVEYASDFRALNKDGEYENYNCETYDSEVKKTVCKRCYTVVKEMYFSEQLFNDIFDKLDKERFIKCSFKEQVHTAEDLLEVML